ncbi:MAG TPA: ABC-2 family transporter protein [Candidatus Saccharimonadales bacterium]|nr:ABC-2 family transporter protein [Candidatus Saccharimonadales bacterium]
MKKYIKVITSTFDEIATYRFNFAVWRFRTVLQLLAIYFLWLTVAPKGGQVFGYTQPLMLTYILGVSFVGSIVISTRTYEIGENINSGELSHFLAKPWSYFGYWFARDIGDKAFNICFSIAELIILYILLKPTLVLQSHIGLVILTLIAISIALLINFFIGCLMGMIGFWSPEVWAPRFIFFILTGFLAGTAFPLDIFPIWFQNILQFSPFTYLLYFPLVIYLNKLTTSQLLSGFVISIIWLAILLFATKYIWSRGLKIYSSHGG